MDHNCTGYNCMGRDKVLLQKSWHMVYRNVIIAQGACSSSNENGNAFSVRTVIQEVIVCSNAIIFGRNATENCSLRASTYVGMRVAMCTDRTSRREGRRREPLMGGPTKGSKSKKITRKKYLCLSSYVK